MREFRDLLGQVVVQRGCTCTQVFVDAGQHAVHGRPDASGLAVQPILEGGEPILQHDGGFVGTGGQPRDEAVAMAGEHGLDRTKPLIDLLQ